MGWKDEEPRLVTAHREQLRLEVVDLEAAVPMEHRARVIWAAVERLDLGAFYDEIAARGSTPGRSAIDPKILLTLPPRPRPSMPINGRGAGCIDSGSVELQRYRASCCSLL